MAQSTEAPGGETAALGPRLAALGRSLGEREAGHREELAAARACAERLRGDVAAALEQFHAAAEAAGAPHLRVELSEIRLDDKHLRAVEFDLVRGRHKAIVVAKSRGELTLVGPFHTGKPEGPCRSFPFDARPEIEQALGTFLESFLEEAATP
ncbi:MAG: hypothetical protein ACQGVC_08110 [Myxococcota bacterium]